jgi:hypothetical protein
MPLGGYWAFWFPENPDGERHGVLERFDTAEECISSLQDIIAREGGGGTVLSKRGDQPFILLRKLGKLWPEADNYPEGSHHELNPTLPDGRPVKLSMVELPTRKSRRRTPKQES